MHIVSVLIAAEGSISTLSDNPAFLMDTVTVQMSFSSLALIFLSLTSDSQFR